MVLYAILFFIARNDFIFALLPPEDGVNGCLPWQPRAGRPHPSSSRIRALCLVTDGFISITVTWVLSNFSPAAFASHLPHFGVRPAYLPLPSHTDIVCWQFTGCPLFLCFLYLLCNRKQQGCSPPTCPWYRRLIPAATGNWGNWLGVTSGFRLGGKKPTNKQCRFHLSARYVGVGFLTPADHHTWPG